MKSDFKETKIIILCGGRGKRMGKFTKKIPKPLLKLGKLTIIEHKMNYYRQQGLRDFIFCTGYKANILKNFIKKRYNDAKFIHTNINSGILKRIYSARKIIKKTSIISYGDTLAKINLKNLIIKHKKSKVLMSIVVAPIQNPFGVVKWNKNEKVTEFHEKPLLNHFIGYAVIEPRIFSYLNNKTINLKDGEGIVKAIKILSSKKLVGVYKFKGLQLTVNSVSELRDARTKIGNYFTFT